MIENLNVSNFLLDRAAFNAWLVAENEDNRSEMSRIKTSLRVVLAEELTPIQREYITHYFLNRMTVEAIAEMYQVNKSTVSRTIHRGLDKVYRFLRVAYPQFLNVAPNRLLRNGKKRNRRSNHELRTYQ